MGSTKGELAGRQYLSATLQSCPRRSLNYKYSTTVSVLPPPVSPFQSSCGDVAELKSKLSLPAAEAAAAADVSTNYALFVFIAGRSKFTFSLSPTAQFVHFGHDSNPIMISGTTTAADAKNCTTHTHLFAQW